MPCEAWVKFGRAWDALPQCPALSHVAFEAPSAQPMGSFASRGLLQQAAARAQQHPMKLGCLNNTCCPLGINPSGYCGILLYYPVGVFVAVAERVCHKVQEGLDTDATMECFQHMTSCQRSAFVVLVYFTRLHA